MDTIFHTLEQLLPTLLIIWLPIDDITIKSVLSYSITKLIIDMIKTFGNILKGFLKYFPVINHYKKNYIKISHKMLQYENLLLYISEKYDTNIVGYSAHCDVDNEIKYDIDEINKIYLNDTFEHEGKTYKIFLQTDKNMIEKNKKLEHEILVKGNCGTIILKKYIENIHFTMSERIISKQNALKIFRMNYDDEGKKRKIFRGWKKYICLTNKTIKNIVPSKAVKVGFLDTIEEFINSAEKYKLRGLPYKIGFALYGEPGCGKTSIVKAIAQHHNIPIFIINLDTIKDNNTLVKVTNMVSNHVTSGKLHILLFEDVDRCKLFKDSRNFYNDDESKSLSMNTLLNILDGVDETHGRINILSANNIKKLENDTALLRPGRIDKVIHMTICCDDQIEKILEIFFPGSGSSVANKLKKEIEITPATLTQIIITLNDVDKIVKFLNKYVTFGEMNYNELFNYMSKYVTLKIKEPVEDDTGNAEGVKVDEEFDDENNDSEIDTNEDDNFNDIIKKKRSIKSRKRQNNNKNKNKKNSKVIEVKPKKIKIIRKQTGKIIDNIMIFKHLIAKNIASNNAELEKIISLLGQESTMNDIRFIKLETEIKEYEGDLKILDHYYNLATRTFNITPDDVLIKMLLITDKFVRKSEFYANRHTITTKEMFTGFYGRAKCKALINSIKTNGSEIIDLQRYNFNGCNYQLLYKLYDEEQKKASTTEIVANETVANEIVANETVANEIVANETVANETTSTETINPKTIANDTETATTKTTNLEIINPKTTITKNRRKKLSDDNEDQYECSEEEDIDNASNDDVSNDEGEFSSEDD